MANSNPWNGINQNYKQMHLILTGTGTSQGVPVITCNCEVCKSGDSRDKRLRTAAVLQHKDTSIVIDAGPDFRQQMLRADVQKIDAVLVTHQHHDHIGGMDDLRPFIFRQNKPMDVYAGIETIQVIQKEYFYAFEENLYPGAPQFNMFQIQNMPFSIKDIDIQPIFAKHANLPVWGFRFGKLAYLTDVKQIDEKECSKLHNLDTLILNALRRGKHHSHLTLEEALELISRIKPKRAVLTHISHDMGKYEEISKLLPENVMLGYDGMELEI